MHVDRYEKIWMIIALVTMIGFLGATAGSVFGNQIQLPGAEGHVNMHAAASDTAAASFEQPNVQQTSPGNYEVHMLAQIWSFAPNEIRIPAGSTLTIYATSRDIVHGLYIQDTNVNIMLLPGQISKATARFDQPGTYIFFCHEYCGTGHQAMSGKIIVE